MAEIYCRRTGEQTFCALPDAEIPKQWKIGELLHVEIKKRRDIQKHRKAFALLGIVYPHTDYPDIEALRGAMTVGSGFVTEIINPMTGDVCFTPKSWAFNNMDDIEFKRLYDRLVDVALKIVPNSTRDDWENTVEELVRM